MSFDLQLVSAHLSSSFLASLVGDSVGGETFVDCLWKDFVKKVNLTTMHNSP